MLHTHLVEELRSKSITNTSQQKTGAPALHPPSMSQHAEAKGCLCLKIYPFFKT